MIKPTIGRKVWFWPSSAVYAAFLTDPNPVSNQPWDATVIAVHGDRLVNLRVTEHLGNTYALEKIPLIQDEDTVSGSQFATWMPYQVKQAKDKA